MGPLFRVCDVWFWGNADGDWWREHNRFSPTHQSGVCWRGYTATLSSIPGDDTVALYPLSPTRHPILYPDRFLFPGRTGISFWGGECLWDHRRVWLPLFPSVSLSKWGPVG